MSAKPIPIRTLSQRYEVLQPLESGGMGTVYRVRDRQTQRELALKTIRDAADPKKLALFLNEIKTLGSFSHPYIVDVYDSGELEEDGVRKPFFVMPLLPGKTLDKIIRHERDRLTLNTCIQIVSQVCRGLQAAHERDIIHRDLKPSNIFVLEGPAVKIIDFGVAHLIDAGRTISGQKGTLLYMAPEQLRGGAASPASDEFSLGAVFYEMLTGVRAFERRNEAEVITAIVNEIPPIVSTLNHDVPLPLSQMIHKMLAKRPEQRFGSMREVLNILERLTRGEPVELFDTARVTQRVELARNANKDNDPQLALEILLRLEAEGCIDPEALRLRDEIDQQIRKKFITQTLQQATKLYEQGEYDLAAQRVQEVLDHDRDNVDARSLERGISQKRESQSLDAWLRLARRHLAANHFDRAREELDRVLKSKPAHLEALQLLQDIEQKQQDYEHLQQEKEKLYGSACSAWQGGDVTKALSWMERVLELDRESPSATAPERSSLYQNLFNQVSAAHGALRAADLDARAARDRGAFEEALAICDHILEQYPQNSAFIALKLDIVERRRQDLSDLIGHVGGQLRAEPNFERRVELLRKALERYPDEPYFQKSLEDAQKALATVNLMVSRARLLEEDGQYDEALNVWDNVATFYPNYPALKSERDRVHLRRERQLMAGRKSRRIAEIDQAVKQGDFAKARSVLALALEEFPRDGELKELQNHIAVLEDRAERAKALLSSGQEKATAADLEGAVDDLRQAHNLDTNSRVIRIVFIETLTRLARALIERDRPRAEELLNEASALDARNASVDSLRKLLADREEDARVDECAAKARRLQAEGKLEDAVTVLQEGLRRSPKDPTLGRIYDEVKQDLLSERAQEQRHGDMQELSRLRDESFNVTSMFDLDKGMDVVTDLKDRYKSDPELQTLAFEVGERLKHAKERVHEQEPVTEPMPAKGAPPIQHAEPPQRPGKPSGMGVRLKAVPSALLRGLQARPKLIAGISCVAALFLIAFAVDKLIRRTSPPPPVTTAVVTITSQPDGAAITVDGKPYGVAGDSGVVISLAPGKHKFTATKAGYDSVEIEREISAGEPIAVSLPMTWNAPVLQVVSDFWGGSLRIDEREPVRITKGEHSQELPQGPHVLTLDAGSASIRLPFEVFPDGRVQIGGDPVAREARLVAIAQSPQGTSIHNPGGLTEIVLDNQKVGTGKAEGLTPLPAGPHTVRISDGKELSFQGTVSIGKTSSLALVAKTDQNVGELVLNLNVPGARISGDNTQGKTIFRREAEKVVAGDNRIPNIRAQKLTIAVRKDGYADWVSEIELRKGINRIPVVLEQKAVFAQLAVTGLPPGTVVYLGSERLGVADAQGGFRADKIQPGEKTIRFQHPQHRSVQISRSFAAGQTVSVAAADTRMGRAPGTVNLSINIPGAQVTATKSGGSAVPLNPGQNELEEGEYRVRAAASGHSAFESTVRVRAGETLPLNVRLEPLKVEAPPPAPSNSMQRFSGVNKCKQEGEWTTCSQGVYAIPVSRGTYQFRLRLKGLRQRAMWRLYLNPQANKKGLMFVLDRKQFVQAHDRRLFDKKYTADHKIDVTKDIPVRIEIGAGVVVHTVNDVQYRTPKDLFDGLDTSGGLFALEVGRDESISIAGFSAR